MKIALIGSTQYSAKFFNKQFELEKLGHEVQIPAFDTKPEWDGLQVCEYNRSIIEWADKVILIWDNRSIGTIFDFGMVFALRKLFEIEYIEPKTFADVMTKYSEQIMLKGL